MVVLVTFIMQWPRMSALQGQWYVMIFSTRISLSQFAGDNKKLNLILYFEVPLDMQFATNSNLLWYLVSHQFLDAVKVLYNRSRVWCILENFQTGVESQLYPALPPLESTDFALLKHDAELIIIRKYVSGFTDLVKKCDEKHLPKIIPNLWRFLLLLSQHYSVYYSSVRTLCVSIYVAIITRWLVH